MTDELAGCVAYIVVFILICIAALVFNPMSCASKFPNNETSWGPIQGCLVSTEKGWIPAENYRVL